MDVETTNEVTTKTVTKMVTAGTKTISVTGTVTTDHLKKADVFTMTLPEVNDNSNTRRKRYKPGEEPKEELSGDVMATISQVQSEMLTWGESLKQYKAEAKQAEQPPTDPTPTPGA